MGREEAIVAAAIVVHHVDQKPHLRVLGRTPSGYQWFDHSIVERSCYEHTQQRTAHDEYNLLYGIIVFQHHIEQRHVERNPRGSSCQRLHQSIKE